MKLRNIFFTGLATLSLLACNDNKINVEYPEYRPPQEEPGEVEGGDIDMSDWPDYTSPAFNSGPSVVKYSQTESTVNGIPFFPMAVYGVNEADMPKVHEYGFNLIQSYQIKPDLSKDIKKWLDTAKENGLMGCINLDGAKLDDNKISQIHQVVTLYKNHPALYAWYLADEPSLSGNGGSAANHIELYNWIKDEDPNHPVISSNWELGNFKDACDVDMRQVYDGIPSYLTPDLERYLNGNVSNLANKTWVAIVNSYHSGWGPKDDCSQLNPTSLFNGLKEGTPEWDAAKAEADNIVKNMKDPEAAGYKICSSFPTTPELLRSSLYWAMLHGSNGFYYWLYSNPESLSWRWGWYTVFHYPKAEAAIQPTLKEFAELSKFLVNPGEASTRFSQGSLYIWSKVVDKRRVIIVTNESTESSSADIDLSRFNIADRPLEVYYPSNKNEDGRETRLDGNTLKGETFGANEVRVYFVK